MRDFGQSDVCESRWVHRIEHLAENAEQVQVLMNNCYPDDAVAGARQLTALAPRREPRGRCTIWELACLTVAALPSRVQGDAHSRRVENAHGS